MKLLPFQEKMLLEYTEDPVRFARRYGPAGEELIAKLTKDPTCLMKPSS